LAILVIFSGCQGFALLDQPPVARFTVTPDPDLLEIQKGDRVVLDATGSTDPQGYELTYAWVLKAPSGSESRLSSTTGKVVSFFPDSPSLFSVSLTVTGRTQSGYSTTRLLDVKSINPTKAFLTVKADGNGTVDPLGFRALGSLDVLTLTATPKTGYRFLRWEVVAGAPSILNPARASTTVSLTPGAEAVIQASFVATTSPPRFWAWTTIPYGFVRVDGTTGTVTPLGSGAVMVVLVRSPSGVLYGIGDTLVPRGARLFRLDATTGLDVAETETIFKDALGAPVTVAGAAFSSSGVLYAVEKGGTHRLFTVFLGTGLLTPLGTLVPAIESLAFSPAGKLLGSDGTALYEINLSTATTTALGFFGTGGVLSSLTFGPGGTLYAADKGNPAKIYSIDPELARPDLLVTLASGGLLSLVAQP